MWASFPWVDAKGGDTAKFALRRWLRWDGIDSTRHIRSQSSVNIELMAITALRVRVARSRSLAPLPRNHSPMPHASLVSLRTLGTALLVAVVVHLERKQSAYWRRAGDRTSNVLTSSPPMCQPAELQPRPSKVQSGHLSHCLLPVLRCLYKSQAHLVAVGSIS
jgi:hypothetical protein